MVSLKLTIMNPIQTKLFVIQRLFFYQFWKVCPFDGYDRQIQGDQRSEDCLSFIGVIGTLNDSSLIFYNIIHVHILWASFTAARILY